MNLYILQLQFINCRIDATHRKGRIGKWQPRKQPRNQRRRRPRRPQKRPRRKSSGSNNPKGNTHRGTLKSVPLGVFAEKKSRTPNDNAARHDQLAETRAGRGDPPFSMNSATPLRSPEHRTLQYEDIAIEKTMTRRRWIAERWDEATATIAGAQAEHLARVLRAQPGMEADVVAGGRVFHATGRRRHPGRRKERSPLQPRRGAPRRPRAARYFGDGRLQVRSHGVGASKKPPSSALPRSRR